MIARDFIEMLIDEYHDAGNVLSKEGARNCLLDYYGLLLGQSLGSGLVYSSP